MTDWVRRYVCDVSRRLPEAERAEVERELKANIRDMLPEEPTEEEIKEVLKQLGAPAGMAEQYRQRPRYLISPAVYDDYIRAVKWVVPLVGVVVMLVGAVIAAVGMVSADVTVAGVINRILSRGLSMGVEGALQALLWTTIGFAIADRTGHGAKMEKEWKPEDLPEELPQKKNRIALSDSIVELVMILFFGILGLLFCSGRFPIAVMLSYSGREVYNLFSEAFLAACIPAIAVCMVFGMAACVVKIVKRRWSLPVCLAVVLNNVVAVAATLVLFGRQNIFSSEAVAFVQGISLEEGKFDPMRFVGNGASNPVLVGIVLVVVAVALADSIVAVYRTARGYRLPKD